MKRILIPLAAGFRMGVALRTAAYRRGWLATRRLNRPVVSVGNLSVGGTGKTPFVAFLAERLLAHGLKPGILTRGYGRRNGADLIAIEPGVGRAPDPREVGDEPALLARKLPQVPIIVCADRYRAGRLAEDKFKVDVHILDDGFQHFALARDVDIVLLDTTQDLSDRELLPAGRLREPCVALVRAHCVVLTRSELADPRPAEERVRKINSKAGIFHCSTKLQGVMDISNGKLIALQAALDGPVYAFCGIGNRPAFFADLEKWGFSVAARSEYPDHHIYKPDEITRLVANARKAGVKILLTTEKDALNFPRMEKTGIPIFACVIQAEVREADALEEALFDRIGIAKVNV
ncbi:MAG: tetraacyldisaccharide 4'-kinase [Terriglobia bacterium]